MKASIWIISVLMWSLVCFASCSKTPEGKNVSPEQGVSSHAKKLVGKWHGMVEDGFGRPEPKVLHFYPDGSFEERWPNRTLNYNAGKYRFMDESHFRTDSSLETWIYDVVELTDTRLVVRKAGASQTYQRSQ